MKTKAISVTLATLMSVQSVAIANTDRTEGIGQQAILSAQENIAALKTAVVNLDLSLEEAAKAIEKRDSRGGVSNGIAVTGAIVGVGLSAVSYLTFKKGVEGSGLAGMFVAAVSIGVTLASTAAGVTSQVRKTEVDTNAVDLQLQEVQKGLDIASSQTQDKSTLALMMQLKNSLKGTQESLAQYQDDKSTETTTRLTANATQLAGIAMTIYGVTQRNSPTLWLGPVIMTAGNIATGIAGMNSEQAEAILKEIEQTRLALRTSAAALN